MRPTKKQRELARQAIGRALFGGRLGYAEPEHDETTFCQTQEQLVKECARAIALAAASKPSSRTRRHERVKHP